LWVALACIFHPPERGLWSRGGREDGDDVRAQSLVQG